MVFGFLKKEGAHKKIIRGSSILFVMSFISAFFGYLTRIILARNLTPTEYGLFFSIFTIVTFFYFLKDFGIKQAVTKYIPQFKVEGRPDKIKGIIIILFITQLVGALILGSALFFSSNFLAEHYFKNPNAAWLMKLMSAYFVVGIAYRFYKAIFQGFQKIGLFSLIDVIKNVSIFIIVFLFTERYGLKATAIAYIFAPILIWIFLFKPFIKLYPKCKSAEKWPLFKQLLFFGIPVMVTAMAGELISYFDTFMLTYFKPLEMVGVYNVVLPTAHMVIVLSRSVSTTIYPMISEYWAKKEFDKVKSGVKFMYKMSPILILFWVVSFVLSRPFIRIFFGEDYVSGTWALRILFAGTLLFFIGLLNNDILAATGHPKENAKSFLPAAGINVVLNLFLIPPYGIEGAAIATFIAFGWVTVYSTYRVKRLILDVKKV